MPMNNRYLGEYRHTVKEFSL